MLKIFLTAALICVIHARNLDDNSRQCDFDTSSCPRCSSLLSHYESNSFGCPISCDCVDDPDMLFEGDIKLKGRSLDYANFIYGLSPDGASHAFTSVTSNYWPASNDGLVRVPYVFESSTNGATRSAIMRVIQDYATNTCIRLVPRTNQGDYIRFISGNGCYSFVGRSGGSQPISIQNNGCTSRGTIIHEIMHAIGFWHEQSRPDRDNFVTINTANIQSGREHNFNRRSQGEINSLNSPYDCGSVMHYSTTAFSRNGQPTITARNSATCVIRRRNFFSEQDLIQINRGYNCAGTTGGTTPPATTTPPSGCTNARGDTNCNYWAGRGFCFGRYQAFMETNCQRACSYCGCSNPRGDQACNYWAGRGFCTGQYEAYMSINCRQACNLC